MENENQIELFLACDHFTVDQLGKASLIGMFERIYLDKLPDALVRCFLIIHLRNVVGEMLDLYHIRPNGLDTLIGSVALTNIQDTKNFKLQMQMINLTFHEEGTHKFALSIKNKRIGELPIQVEQVQQRNKT